MQTQVIPTLGINDRCLTIAVLTSDRRVVALVLHCRVRERGGVLSRHAQHGEIAGQCRAAAATRLRRRHHPADHGSCARAFRSGRWNDITFISKYLYKDGNKIMLDSFITSTDSVKPVQPFRRLAETSKHTDKLSTQAFKVKPIV